VTEPIDIFTKEPIDKRRKPSNLVRMVMERMATYTGEKPYRSIVVALIDAEGQHITDYIVQPEDFAPMCVVLGALADEMSDLSLGLEDLED
jgi:hypothetical protein